MRAALRSVFAGAALLLAVLLAAGAAGIARGTAVAPAAGKSGRAYFHGGKEASAPPADRVCQNGKCHPGAPHAKPVAEAAFRNMHAAMVDCLACHGKDYESRWAPADARGGGRKVSYAAGPAAGHHDLLGRPAGCRSCHEESGREAMRKRGIANLAPNFASPIALKMLEGRGKNWVPADIR